MADYSELKQNIASVIKSNNRREITGQILQNVLNQMVGSLGENYQLAGFAEPTTNPQEPDQTLFYIAEQAGVYTNFDNITLGDGLSFLMWKNSEWTSHTIGVATHSWVDSNYVSKAFLRQIFRVYDADGFEILPNDTTSIADNIKAMVGLWTNQYLSALGLGDDGQTGAQYLTQLGDVDIDSTTLADGQVLVYDNGLWVNGQAGGVDMSVVWSALAGNTNEQINSSHLTTALTGYVTTSSLSTTLADYVTTTALNTALASYASQSWVSQNYVSIAFLNRILRAYDSTDTQVQPNDTTTAIDNLKAMVGLWTEQYLSALGQGNDGGGGGYITTLGQLEDVTLTTPSVGQALVYAEVESGVYKWVNGTAGVDMSSVWTALAGGTNEQIALSHLTTALSGYVTTGGLSTTLADYVTATALSTTLADYVTATSLSTTLASYATQQWVGQNYISIAFFNRLFAAYDSNDVIINPNDTTTAVDNIKALVGLWTQQYLSALGQGSDGGVVTSLANLTDVDLGSTINNNDVLTYDSSTNKWTNKPAQGGSTVAALGDLTDVGISSLADKDILQYDYTNNVWKNVTLATALSGYATTSQLANYLPLSGGTLTGSLTGTSITAKDDLYVKSSSSVERRLTILNALSTYYVGVQADGLAYLWQVNNYDLKFGTYATERMRISKSGNIGIGTSTPSHRLEIVDNTLADNNVVQITNSNSGASICAISLYRNSTHGLRIGTFINHAFFYNPISNCEIEILNTGGNDGLQFHNGTTAYKVWHAGNLTNNNQLSNGAGYITGITSSMVTGALGYTPANSTALSSYLPLSGGTLTGTLTLDTSIYFAKGAINSTIKSQWGHYSDYVFFSNEAGQYEFRLKDNGELLYGHYQSGTMYNIWHSGNLTAVSQLTNDSGYITSSGSCAYATSAGSATDSTKLPLTGGTISGGNNFRPLIVGGTYSGITEIGIMNGNTVYSGFGYNNGYTFMGREDGGGYPKIAIRHSDGALVYSPDNLYSIKMYVTSSGNIVASGGVTALSDERDKEVLGNTTITVEQIAQMPTVLYRWNDGREDMSIHAGTLAQRWEPYLPQVVMKAPDERQTRSFAYGVAALIAATIDARKIVDHDRLLREQAAKISELENKCSFLEREVERLKCA